MKERSIISPTAIFQSKCLSNRFLIRILVTMTSASEGSGENSKCNGFEFEVMCWVTGSTKE